MEEALETVLQSMRKRRKFIEKEPTGGMLQSTHTLAQRDHICICIAQFFRSIDLGIDLND